jgi:hypothetical protein
VHVSGVAGLPATRLCAETDVLHRERRARSERRSVSESYAVLWQKNHTHPKDTGMPINWRHAERQRNANMSHMLSLLGPTVHG